MFSRKKLVLGLAALALAACSGSSGGGGGGTGSGGNDPSKPTPPPFETPAPTPPTNAPVKEGSTGTYKATGQLTEADVFGPGCKTPGKQSDAVPQLDSRLKKSMAFEMKQESSTGKDGYQMLTLVQEITSMITGGFANKLTVKAVENIADLKPGMTGNQECVFNAGTGDMDCKAVQVMSIRSRLKMSRFGVLDIDSDCDVKEKSDADIAFQASKGSYAFAAGGKTVSSFEQVLDIKGDLICSGKNLGAGVKHIRIVLSNDVPSTDSRFCGGVPLYFYGKVGRASQDLPIESSSFDQTWLK